MRIVSLCSGYGGLEMGLLAALGGGEVVCHAEIDPDAALVLDRRFPGVPNVGDITVVDWLSLSLGRVNWLCAGFPCQDVSPAGRREGLRPGTRSGLWYHVARAVAELRPDRVLIENSGGLFSAKGETAPAAEGAADVACEAGGVDGDDVDDWSDGDLRAIGVVVGDLATLGYDATWCLVRASDAGAAHARARAYIVAARDAEGDWRGGIAVEGAVES